MSNIYFRASGPHDQLATRKIVEEAFGDAGEETADFLDALRDDGCILGEWLAEDGRMPIGHIVFSRVWIEQPDGVRMEAAMLTPLAVRPDRQRTGVGLKLMEHTMKLLEQRGEIIFLVLGHPDYYPRAGFNAVAANNVTSPWPGEPAFMARGANLPKGRLVMPAVIADAH